MSPASGQIVVHAYGLVPGTDGLSLPEGIDGRPVETMTVGSLSALISALDANRYGPQAWEEHAEDLAWINQLVNEHHRVLQQAVEQGDVLPLRLSTIHSDAPALKRAMEEHETELTAALERVRGHVEMGVKVYAADAASASTGQPRPASGRDYLTQRSSAARRQEEDWARRQAGALHLHEELALGSTHSRVNEPQDSALSGRGEAMLLNAAYLVPRDDIETFVAQVSVLGERVAGSGLAVECTGPWPAYNFADDSPGIGSSA